MRKIFVPLLLSLLVGHVCSQTYCLENDITHDYLNDFSYDDYLDDYDVSFILHYDSLPHDYRLDAPKPVRLSWTHTPGAEAQKIEVSESSTYDDAYVYSVHADSAAYDVYNLIPGKTYYYRVVSTSGGVDTTVDSGSFETTGLLRMIYAEGTWNVRDAGGWISGLNGKPIAYGKIFRGAQLKAKGKDSIILSKDGINALRMVGIKAELDLRSNDQVPSNVSALASADYAVDFTVIPEAVNARMYHFQNNDATIRELQWIINRLKQNKPVYYHCQNGADRTGTLGFLIGALLGMSEGDLAKDYELTTFCKDAAVAYDPTEKGFARLRNYTGKMGSPLGSSEDNKEYMFAELANTMKTVSPADGTYQQKIYNFFRNGVNGTKISPADLSWFIMEMTGYPVLGGMNVDVDSLKLELAGTHQLIVTPFPEKAEYNAITYKSTSKKVATVSDKGLVTATGGGSAYIIVDVDGIEKYIPVEVPITEESIPAYSIENELVSRYMSEVSYDSNDYTSSLIEKYDTVTTQYRKDWPQAVSVRWTLNAGASNQNIVVSESSDFTKSVSEGAVGNADSTYRVEGLLPQGIYYYSIIATISGESVYLTKSAFKTVGTVRMIKTQNIPNIRDLGGWTGLEGHKVKYGVIFRGSRLRESIADGGAALTDATDNSTLRGWGIGAELELRSNDECNATTAVLNRRQVKFAKVPNAAECQGANILTGDAYIVALNTIIGWAKDGKGVYVSSSLGAHRTGTLAFLINGLLGVDEESLSKDYELSSFSEDDLTNVLCKRTDADFVAMVSALKSLPGETLQNKIYNYFMTGVGGKSVPEADLVWFINYMLGAEVVTPTSVPYISNAGVQDDRIYDLLGQEVLNPSKGVYIRNGKKFIIK